MWTYDTRIEWKLCQPFLYGYWQSCTINKTDDVCADFSGDYEKMIWHNKLPRKKDSKTITCEEKAEK